MYIILSCVDFLFRGGEFAAGRLILDCEKKIILPQINTDYHRFNLGVGEYKNTRNQVLKNAEKKSFSRSWR
jgi:hypothetical protein